MRLGYQISVYIQAASTAIHLFQADSTAIHLFQADSASKCTVHQGTRPIIDKKSQSPNQQ